MPQRTGIGDRSGGKYRTTGLGLEEHHVGMDSLVDHAVGQSVRDTHLLVHQPYVLEWFSDCATTSQRAAACPASGRRSRSPILLHRLAGSQSRRESSGTPSKMNAARGSCEASVRVQYDEWSNPG
jgi:hypothetical protein